MNDEQAIASPTSQPSNLQYFESATPDGDGACSWDPVRAEDLALGYHEALDMFISRNPPLTFAETV